MGYTARLAIHEVVKVKPGDSVASAAKTLKTSNIGAVLVCEQGARPLGIFTERDLCRRVVAEGLDPKSTTVEAVMTKDLITVDASDPLDRVFEQLAEGRFRHLPITDSGEVVGIVSLTDLAKVLRLVYKEEKYIEYFADSVQSR